MAIRITFRDRKLRRMKAFGYINSPLLNWRMLALYWFRIEF